MEHQSVRIPFSDLHIGENVRLPGRYNLPPLAEAIAQQGLITPIIAWKDQTGKVTVLQGHRRKAAIGLLKENNPTAFKKHFANGVPVTLVSGITEAEAMEMKVDHGNELSLADPFELQLCANLLFKAGLTEEAVSVDLCGLMERLRPMKADAKKKLDELRTNLATAKTAKDNQKAGEIDGLISKHIADYRRGMVQNLHNTFRTPEVVMAALYKEASGETPKGYEKVDLPKLTTADVTALWQAAAKDFKVMKEGLPQFNKRNPGPEFRAKWTGIIDAQKKKASETPDTTPRPKAKSAKDVVAALESGEFSAPLSHAMQQWFLGKEVSNLRQLDENAHYAELVAKHDPKAWESFIKDAKGLEAEVLDLNQSAKPVKGKEAVNMTPEKGAEETSDGLPVPKA